MVVGSLILAVAHAVGVILGGVSLLVFDFDASSTHAHVHPLLVVVGYAHTRAGDRSLLDVGALARVRVGVLSLFDAGVLVHVGVCGDLERQVPTGHEYSGA